MRNAFVLAPTSIALALALAAACAGQEDEASPLNDAGAPSAQDGAAETGAARDSAGPGGPLCSAAGWCATKLPDDDLSLKDIWPLEGRAFAIAESETLGVKILEWEGATEKWNYIDDNRQNAFGFAKYGGAVWAPSENEVYYGVAPAFVYHGKRSSPSSPWTWESSRLESHSRDTDPAHDPGLARYTKSYEPEVTFAALGVWGTSAADVYAWYANTVFHWKSEDGGPPAWVAEHIEDDPENLADTFFVFGASGTGPDDIWFAGGRGRYDETGAFACPVVLHKTAAGYRRVVDNVIHDEDVFYHYSDTCRPKAGVLDFRYSYRESDAGLVTGPWKNGGWLTGIEAAGPGAAIGIVGGEQFAYVTSAQDGGGGTAHVNFVKARVPHGSGSVLLNSVWLDGTSAWLTGWGIVLQVDKDPEAWSRGLGVYSGGLAVAGAAKFNVSTTVLRGAPIDGPLYRVRGTSKTNVWAIGAGYALHKTTP